MKAVLFKSYIIALCLLMPSVVYAQVNTGPGIPLEFQIDGTTEMTLRTDGILTTDKAIIIGTTVTCDGTTEGALRYNSTDKKIEFCNGIIWTTFVQTQGAPAPTAPAGSGYFVLSSTAHNGDFGGWPAGADSVCLNDLTTNTGWQGYAAALANGQLIAGKVRALLCVNPSGCTNLMPVTTYYFANAGDGSAGGAFFTTDVTGRGPGDSANWAAANYFSLSVTYWTNRSSGSNTLWSNSYYNPSCNSWSDSTSLNSSRLGSSSNTNANRWTGTNSTCDNAHYFICAVNP